LKLVYWTEETNTGIPDCILRYGEDPTDGCMACHHTVKWDAKLKECTSDGTRAGKMLVDNKIFARCPQDCMSCDDEIKCLNCGNGLKINSEPIENCVSLCYSDHVVS
jgi:hypothetical protein